MLPPKKLLLELQNTLYCTSCQKSEIMWSAETSKIAFFFCLSISNTYHLYPLTQNLSQLLQPCSKFLVQGLEIVLSAPSMQPGTCLAGFINFSGYSGVGGDSDKDQPGPCQVFKAWNSFSASIGQQQIQQGLPASVVLCGNFPCLVSLCRAI